MVGPFVANKNKVYVRSLSFTRETLAHLDLIPGVIGPLCRDTKRCTLPTLTELIARVPWREAVTYRDTWPHEYVLTGKDSQKELLAAVCERFRAGEGVACRFFRMNNTYLFIGDQQVLADDRLQRRRRLRHQPGAPLPGPPRLRHPTGRYREARGLPGESGASELGDSGRVFIVRYRHLAGLAILKLKWIRVWRATGIEPEVSNECFSP